MFVKNVLSTHVDQIYSSANYRHSIFKLTEIAHYLYYSFLPYIIIFYDAIIVYVYGLVCTLKDSVEILKGHGCSKVCRLDLSMNLRLAFTALHLKYHESYLVYVICNFTTLPLMVCSICMGLL